MSTLGWFHTAFAVAAMSFGAVVVLRDKATFAHRVAGWMYVSSMLGLNVTALFIYRLFGHFGPFHFAALVSLVTVLIGLSMVLFRPEGWLMLHYKIMSWSYVGLLAAAASEVGTRTRIFHFWWVVLGATAIVVGVGAWIIQRSERGIVERYGRLAGR